METPWETPVTPEGGASTAPDTRAPLGRTAELERLRGCVRQDAGAPRTTVLLGEEGIGKSRLLRATAEFATEHGHLVLSAHGWSAERGTPFAALRQLLAPLAERVEQLPEPHRRVLRTALGLEPDGQDRPATPVDLAAVRTACTSLLDGLGPVLVTVDDAHHCDAQTVDLLGSLLRAGQESVLSALFASRDGDLLLDLPGDAEVTHLAPLSVREAAELLDAQPGAPEGRSRLELLDEAHGNPSAVLELCRMRASHPDQVLARERSARPHHLGGHIKAQLARLPEPTRRALSAAALALPDDDAAAVMTALGTDDLGVWTAAEEAGVVALIDGRVVFRHPLARVVAATGQPALLRHQVHRSLADQAAARPLDRARHLAAAALGPDASVAAELRAAARSCVDEFTTARVLEDAARLTGEPGERAERLTEALGAARAVGEPGWVHELHGYLVLEDAEPRLRRDAALVAAEALSLTGRQKEAFRLLQHAAEQAPPEDPAAAVAIAAAATAIADQSGLRLHYDELAALLARVDEAATHGRVQSDARGPLGGGGRHAVAAGTPGTAEARSGDLGATIASSGTRGAAYASSTNPSSTNRGTADADADATAPGAARATARSVAPLPPGTGQAPAVPGAASPGAARLATVAPSNAASGPVRPIVTESTTALAAYSRAVAGVPGAARQLLRRLATPRLGPLLDDPARMVPWIAIGQVAYHADEPDGCLEHLRVAELLLRTRRAFGRRAPYVAPLLDTLLATGRWTEADALLDEATEKAAVLRLPRVLADLDAARTTLSALRATSTTATAQPQSQSHRQLPLDLQENGATRARLTRAAALLAFSRGDWADAFRRLRSLFDEDGAPLHPFHSPRVIAELALAAQRAGQTEEAARVLARVRQAQGERPTARMTLQLHHATALLEPGPDPEHHFRLALVNAAGEAWPLERAQARLSYAIWLRRVRRPSEARQQLAAALEIAESLGAGYVTAWIRHELRASGVATDRDSGTALAELTAQQQQIVRMAAEGMSNREIGEQLFLSPRTVGTHLYNVYPKLGVTRRHQLRDLLQNR